MPEFMSDLVANNISEIDLKNAHDTVVKSWELNLKSLGVKRPPKYGSISAAQLDILAYGYPNTFIVTKKQVVSILNKLGYKSNDPQQVRHLADQYGYCIWRYDRIKYEVTNATKGCYLLKTLENPIPGFNQIKGRRNAVGIFGMLYALIVFVGKETLILDLVE
jgi:hypothetical protein